MVPSNVLDSVEPQEKPVKILADMGFLSKSAREKRVTAARYRIRVSDRLDRLRV